MAEFTIERNTLKRCNLGNDEVIIIPDGVKRIESFAFFFVGENNVKKIVIPDSVKSIEDDTFKYSNITEINIPEGVSKLGKGLFYHCKELKTITIPKGVTRIGNQAFADCKSLTDITIPESVTDMGWGMLRGDTALESITIPFVGARQIEKNYLGHIFGAATYKSNYGAVPSSLKTVTITGPCKTIASHAFYSCVNLEKIVIPEGVTDIGDEAFAGCTGLNELVLPVSVENIGRDAFKGCNKLTIVACEASYAGLFANNSGIKVKLVDYVPEKDEPITTEKKESKKEKKDSDVDLKSVWRVEIFEHAKECYLSNYKGNAEILVIPQSYEGNKVTRIYKSQNFKNKGYDSVKEVILPNTIIEIGDNAFSNCHQLESIAIPDKVKKIGENAFLNCINLENLTLGNGLKEIGNFAFRRCEKIKEITIAKGVNRIWERGLFRDCKSLEKVIFENRKRIEFNSLNHNSRGMLTGAPKANIYLHKGTVLKDCDIPAKRIKYIEEE